MNEQYLNDLKSILKCFLVLEKSTIKMNIFESKSGTISKLEESKWEQYFSTETLNEVEITIQSPKIICNETKLSSRISNDIVSI